jgi:Cu/Ag efflux pump CusA
VPERVALDDAIAEAAEVRFLPILLTPLALQGSGLYSPLAIVIIGGLVSSTLLARLVTPVMQELRGSRGQPRASKQHAQNRVQHHHWPKQRTLEAARQPHVNE